MIKFGTDGWRAVIADEFTFENVSVVSQAVAEYIKSEDKLRDGVVIGYDNRFLSEKFARKAADVLVSNGISVYLCEQAVPTPVLSFSVVKHKSFLGIMITASHNPYEYNGYKIKMDCGASASQEITKAIESNLNKVSPLIDEKELSNVIYINPKNEYIEYVKQIVDFENFKKADFEIIVDNLYGPGAGYITDILSETAIKVTEINNYRDPLFGGVNPEPLAQNTPELLEMMQEEKSWRVGIVLDGDADRIALVNSQGKFISAQETFVLLLEYMFAVKKKQGAVAKAFNMTRMLDKLAKKYGINLIETKIGFKYLATYLINKEVILAGEESGGYGTSMHLPERDGVFNALLIIELLALTNKKPEEILQSVMQEVGSYYYSRIDISTPDSKVKDAVMNSLLSETIREFGSIPVKEKIEFDGIKFLLENDGWILFRTSGTENLLRVYAEGRSEDNLKSILNSGKTYVERFIKT
ncbi:MAG: hypothetical protein A2X42_10235 [Candidatus Margulisbacteria bacterium GWF2_38_17]|nr:MAG: hypothetical protein A2X42_10235 [Candidatus Margulisbacteria bacterium GWF2_38_17]